MNSKTVFSTLALAMLFLVANVQRGACQQPSEMRDESSAKVAAATSPAVKGDMVKTSSPPKITGRLPRYFAAVVNAAQRLEIYTIHAGYREKIEEMEQRLEELRQAQLAAVEKVLTS